MGGRGEKKERKKERERAQGKNSPCKKNRDVMVSSSSDEETREK
jgi:hypothetical protein